MILKFTNLISNGQIIQAINESFRIKIGGIFVNANQQEIISAFFVIFEIIAIFATDMDKTLYIMSDKDYIEFSKKLDEGLLLAEKRMLQEKALHDESVVVCDNNNKIKRIPAKQIISENVIFQ